MSRNNAFSVLESAARVGTWALEYSTRSLTWSPGIYRILGLDPAGPTPDLDTAIGFFSADSQVLLRHTLADCETQGSGFNLELELVHRDGSLRHVQSVAEPFRRDGRVVGLKGAFLDVEDQYRARCERESLNRLIADSEARWQFAIDGSGLGLWDWDSTTDRVYFSDQWKAILGFAAEEVGDNFDEWSSRVHPDDLPGCLTDLDAHFSGQSPVYDNEHRMRCRDGSYKWIHARGRVIAWQEEGKPARVIGTHADIDDRKQAEARLAESEDRFRGLFENLYQFTGLLAPDGTLLEANTRALDFAGVGRGAVIGQKLWDCPWFAHSDAVSQAMRDAVARGAQGEFVRFNVEISVAEGRTTIDFSLTPYRNARGEIELLVPEGRDISEMLTAQSALQESERRFHQSFDYAPIGKALVSPDGRFLAVNTSICRMLGYCREELLCSDFQALTHPDDLDKDLAQVRALLDGTKNAYRIEKRYRHKKGHVVYAQLDVSLLRDDRGEPIHFISQIQDITQRKRAEDALFEANELAQVTLAAIGEGMLRCDAGAVITLCNPAAAALLGVEPRAVEGKAFGDVVELFHPSETRRVEDPMARVLADGRPMRVPVFTRLRRPDGRMIPVADSVSPMRDRVGRVIGAVFVFQDMSETQRITAQLTHQADHDTLTGLPNRRRFGSLLGDAWRRARRGRWSGFVMYLDLDHFKAVNDTGGHAVGDRVLREIAEVMAGSLRGDDILARLGGDEFAAIVESATPEEAEVLADRMIKAVESYGLVADGRRFTVGLSIGLASIDITVGDPAEILARADQALYVAKETGRHRWHRFTPGDADIGRNTSTLDMAQRLRRALDSGNLALHLQAIVNGEGEVAGYEALVRLRDERGRLHAPATFLPAAKRLGLLARVDESVAASAVRLIREGVESGTWIAGRYISVNVSATSLGDPGFAKRLGRMLADARLPVGSLRFEVTETDRIDGNAALDLIRTLRRSGHEVWLDDFGTGYNSFDLLKSLRVDGVKIDRDFSCDIDNDPVGHSLIRAVMEVAGAMKLGVVAEGVEDEGALDRLQDLGVEYFQGHHFQQAGDAPSVLARSTGPPAQP